VRYEDGDVRERDPLELRREVCGTSSPRPISCASSRRLTCLRERNHAA
jgi:hypothetical protein